MCITVKVNVYRLGKTWRVRSGHGTWTRPDPTRQGLDPTRPAVFVNIRDPTQPDPRVDQIRDTSARAWVVELNVLAIQIV